MKYKTFEEMMDDSIKKEPLWGTYLHLCSCIQESGMEREEIESWFKKYMVVKEDYDRSEKNELIDYLLKISLEIPE